MPDSSHSCVLSCGGVNRSGYGTVKTAPGNARVPSNDVLTAASSPALPARVKTAYNYNSYIWPTCRRVVTVRSGSTNSGMSQVK